MTVIATKNDSEVLSGLVMDNVADLVLDYNYQHNETFTAASATAVSIGDVVVWDVDHWELAATGATLNGDGAFTTGGKGIAVVAGFNSLGDTFSKEITSDKIVVLYQGPVNVKEAGLTFGTLDATETTAAKVQLAKNGLKIKATAATLNSNFYNSSLSA